MMYAPDLAGVRHKANPIPLYSQIRAETPVVQIMAGDKKPAWLLTRYSDVAQALKDPRLGKNAFRILRPDELKTQVTWVPSFLRPLACTMLDQDPPDHNRLRSLVHQAFTPKRVEDLRGRVQTLTNELIAKARRRGEFDLMESIAAPLPMTVICEMLGVPEEDRARFRSMTNRIVTIVSPTDMFLAMPILWMFVRYVRSLIERRRKSPGDDLLTALILAEEAGSRMSQDELVAMAFLLLVAGHETTVNLITSGTLALLDDPASLERLRKEPGLLKSSVEELLRFTTPVEIATERYTTEEVTYGDQKIPRGQRIFASLFAANFDNDVFEHPERLQLDREPNRHLAFGAGAHYCLGAPLARMEGQIALHAIVNELPGLRLAIPRSSVRWKPSLGLRSLVRLPVHCHRSSTYVGQDRHRAAVAG